MRTYVLWGNHPAHGPVMLKLKAGTLAECRRELKQRTAEKWTNLVILRERIAP